MLKNEFLIPMEKWMTAISILAILLGAVLIAIVDWTILGGVTVIYGVLSLFLAYHLGVAPCVEELETGEVLLVRSGLDARLRGETGEMQPEWLAEYET
ncbi:MAG TPA: hypothetical protein VLY63_17625 [Anaerolineae bacterium]|nr:hypothetical protein [Anaerolineae bacterium]